MAARVVWLVANRIVRRDEVLGLTFTRKAAGELAERIQRRLQRLAEFERRGLLAAPARPARGGPPRGLRRARALGRRRGEGDRRARTPRWTRSPPRSGATPRGARRRRAAAPPHGRDLQQLRRPDRARARACGSGGMPRPSSCRSRRRGCSCAASCSPPTTRGSRRRGEAVRSIVDAALRIARDGVDNLVVVRRARRVPRAVPRRARAAVDAQGRPSSTPTSPRPRRRSGRWRCSPTSPASTRRRSAASACIDFSDQVAGALEVVRAPPGRRRRGARPIPRRAPRRVPGHLGRADRSARRAVRRHRA